MARKIDARYMVGKSHEEVSAALRNMDDQDLRYIWERPWIIGEYERQGFTEEMEALKGRFDAQGNLTPKTDPTVITTDDMRVGTQTPQHLLPRPQLVDPSLNPLENEDDEDDYESWSKQELVDEVNSRNEDRADGDKMSASGNKDQLIERLRADDAAEAAVPGT